MARTEGVGGAGAREALNHQSSNPPGQVRVGTTVAAHITRPKGTHREVPEGMCCDRSRGTPVRTLFASSTDPSMMSPMSPSRFLAPAIS